MPVLNTYIRSITTAGRVLIERVLSQGTAEGDDTPILLGGRDDLNVSVEPLTVVEASKMNFIFSNVANRNKVLWNAVDRADKRCRRINEISKASVSSSSRTIAKMNAMLEGILSAAGRGESVSGVYLEMFNDVGGTDLLKTDALIIDGKLALPYKTIASANGTWSIASQMPTGTVTISDPKMGSMNATYSRGSSGTSAQSYTVVMKCSFPQPTSVQGLSIWSGPVDIESVEVVSQEANRSQALNVDTRVSGKGNTIVWLNHPHPVSQILVKFVQRHYSPVPSQGMGKYAFEWLYKKIISPRVRELIDSVSMIQGSTENLLKSSDLGRPSDGNMTPYFYGENVTYDIKVSSIGLLAAERLKDARWTSRSFTLDGDVKYLTINVDGTYPVGTNVYWMLSVEGSSDWIDIVPGNKREVLYERMDFDPLGVHTLKYPADPSLPQTIEGQADGTVVTWINDPETGFVVRCDVDRPQPGGVTISYTTAYSGILNFEELGLSSANTRLVDAMTDGELGERFSSSLNERVTLKNQPSGTPLVYVAGRKAIKLNDDQGFGDPDLESNRTYFKIVGRTLYFGKNVTNISVYYKFLRTSMRLRARLTTTDTHIGNTPLVDSVFVGVRMETI